MRDIVSGLFVVILLAARSTHLLGWIMLAGALIPVGDAMVPQRPGKDPLLQPGWNLPGQRHAVREDLRSAESIDRDAAQPSGR